MAPESGFKRTVHNLFGFRGRQNILAWTVAGSLAYYFYIKPEQEREEEQRLARELTRQLAEEQALRETGVVVAAVASLERRKLAALEVEALIKDLASKGDQTNRIFLIVDALASYALPSPNTNSSNPRKGGLLCLAATAVAVSSTPPLSQNEVFISKVCPPILLACTDVNSRIRYYAVEALYNVAKSTRPAILMLFPEIFDILFKLCSDPEHSVKNASSILAELIKSTVADSPAFPMHQFLVKLSESMAVENSLQRQFVLSWIELLDGLPHADLKLLRSLPMLVAGLLDFQNDAAQEVEQRAGKLLKQLIVDASSNKVVDIKEIVGALTAWLNESKDYKSRAVVAALESLKVLVAAAAAPEQLSDLSPAILKACLHSFDTVDADIQALGAELNELLFASMAGCGNVDVDELLLDVAAEGIGSMQETSRLEALRWTAELLRRNSSSPSSSNNSKKKLNFTSLEMSNTLLTALQDGLHSTSDRVVHEVVSVLAAASGSGAQGCKKAIESVFAVFRGITGAKLLQSRGTTIIEQLCQRMGSQRVLSTMGELLKTESEDQDFAKMMAQALALILITSPQLESARHSVSVALKHGNTDQKQLFKDLYAGLCCSTMAALSIAFLSREYCLAAEIVRLLTEPPLLANMANNVVELGQVVALLEAPTFAATRLELLSPPEDLIRALYSLLLVLPQGDSFRLLQNRLQCIPGGFNNNSSFSLKLENGVNLDSKVRELAEQFIQSQSTAR